MTFSGMIIAYNREISSESPGIFYQAENRPKDQKIKTNSIRFSIGAEHMDDIIADLQNGFDAVK